MGRGGSKCPKRGHPHRDAEQPEAYRERGGGVETFWSSIVKQPRHAKRYLRKLSYNNIVGGVMIYKGTMELHFKVETPSSVLYSWCPHSINMSFLISQNFCPLSLSRQNKAASIRPRGRAYFAVFINKCVAQAWNTEWMNGQNTRVLEKRKHRYLGRRFCFGSRTRVFNSA